LLNCQQFVASKISNFKNFILEIAYFACYKLLAIQQTLLKLQHSRCFGNGEADDVRKLK